MIFHAADTRLLLILLLSLFLSACTGMPEGVTPVNEFNLSKYLGKWYEIARLDHSFERGLDNISADYSLRDDGGVKVINKGYSKKNNEWKQSEGKAYFVKSTDLGYLKVSFFGPFYGSYIIFELDRENYQYAFVSGPDSSYLWLLSRTPTVNENIIKMFIEKSKELGFDTEKLIYVTHNKTEKNRS
jgi:apolipoprotein D and lipocalin family protein